MSAESNKIKEKFSQIMERWFIQEPAFFEVMCMHELCENTQMRCPVRCGRKRIEYNSSLLSQMNDAQIEEYLKCEALRILLKHPYERRPEECSMSSAASGSNLVLSDHYEFHEIELEESRNWKLSDKMPYEWYARRIQKLSQDNGSSSGGMGAGSETDADQESRADLAGLWEEDSLTAELINRAISKITDWGSIPWDAAVMIKESLKAKIDWKKALFGFRGSILSSHKKLTRMKPSRRYGFQAMGSQREFDSRLLVAVDVSGSISDKTLQYFYGVIESAFRYGFTNVDTLQFDCRISVIENLSCAKRNIAVVGRGGTSFQEPLDYAFSHGYDGIVILTDGYAPVPKIPQGHTKILWVCEDEHCYEHNKEWMKKTGRVTLMNRK